MFEHIPLVLAQENDLQPLGSGPDPPGDGGTETSGADPSTNQPSSAPPFGGNFMFLLLGMMVLMLVFSFRNQRKEKKRREKMIAEMKKGDQVVTRGGILGAVVDMRENEIVLKVDENANTRIRFDRTAVDLVQPKKSD